MTKVVSCWCISRVIACISSSLKPRASGKTTSGLPARRTFENTSHCTKGKRRECFVSPLAKSAASNAAMERRIVLRLAVCMG